MMQVIPAGERYGFEYEWVKGYWHFSFDSYRDPNNMNFGSLRVFNEDWIQPESGFPMHPHRDMEIVTFVVDGELTHEDSMGNKGVIRAGEVQCMTAGTGVYHSEYNASKDTTSHSLQMWVLPKERDLKPSYAQKPFTGKQRRNRWLPVVSGSPKEDALLINQDATFYVTSLQKDKTLAHPLNGRAAYLFIIQGSAHLGSQILNTGDQVKMMEEEKLTLQAMSDCDMILIEV